LFHRYLEAGGIEPPSNPRKCREKRTFWRQRSAMRSARRSGTGHGRRSVTDRRSVGNPARSGAPCHHRMVRGLRVLPGRARLWGRREHRPTPVGFIFDEGRSMKMKGDWRVRKDGMAVRAPYCPCGGRHVARGKVPKDGVLPRCGKCGNAFSFEVLPAEVVRMQQ